MSKICYYKKRVPNYAMTMVNISNFKNFEFEFQIGTVNPQLESHCHPLPRSEDLIQKLGGEFGFTKINLADAYKQSRFAPELRKRLALSAHREFCYKMFCPSEFLHH